MLTVTVEIIVIILVILNGCKSREEGKILVLYSSFFDFNTNDTAEIEMTLNFSSQRLKFVDLDASSCSDQRISALHTLMENWILINSEFSLVVGPSCSASAYAVARLIRRSGVSVRHWHTAPLPAPLAAEVRGTSEGLLPPADLLADASVALVKHAGWSKILVLYQLSNIDMLYIFDHFQREIEEYYKQKYEMKHGKRKLHISPILGEAHLNRTLHQYAARIVFIMADMETTAVILCRALELGAVFPAFQWIIMKASIEATIQTLEKITFTRTAITKVINNALFINYPFQVELNESSKNFNSALLYSNTIQIASQDSSSHHQLFLPRVYIIQSNNSKPTVVSEYHNGSLLNIKKIVFISSSLESVLNIVYFPLGIFFIALNSVLLLVCLLLHFVTVLYRKEHSVKSGSILLLHTTYIGMYMVNAASAIYFIQKTFLIVSDSLYTKMCQGFLPLMGVGVTLLFGTLLAKTWRLYKIFIHYMDPGNFLSDISLTCFVVCLTFVDIAICLAWFVVDPIHREQFEVSRNEREGQVIVQAVCESQAYIEMLALLMLYQIIIIGMTMYLVFKLRKNVPKRHKNLRSASTVRLSFIMAFGILFLVPGYVLSHYYLRAIEFEYTMVGVMFDSLQLFFIILIFIPPLRPIIMHKFLLLAHNINLK